MPLNKETKPNQSKPKMVIGYIYIYIYIWKVKWVIADSTNSVTKSFMK